MMLCVARLVVWHMARAVKTDPTAVFPLVYFWQCQLYIYFSKHLSLTAIWGKTNQNTVVSLIYQSLEHTANTMMRTPIPTRHQATSWNATWWSRSCRHAPAPSTLLCQTLGRLALTSRQRCKNETCHWSIFLARRVCYPLVGIKQTPSQSSFHYQTENSMFSNVTTPQQTKYKLPYMTGWKTSFSLTVGGNTKMFPSVQRTVLTPKHDLMNHLLFLLFFII